MKKVFMFLCVIWIGFIFYNSSQVGTESTSTTSSLINSVKSAINGEEVSIDDISYGASKANIKLSLKSILETIKSNINGWKDSTRSTKIYYLFRKCAHGFEFFILAFIVSLIFLKTNVTRREAITYTLFIVLLCAVFDEYFQIYIQGRSSSVSDVLIDFIGGILSILVFNFIRNFVESLSLSIRKNKSKRKVMKRTKLNKI